MPSHQPSHQPSHLQHHTDHHPAVRTAWRGLAALLLLATVLAAGWPASATHAQTPEPPDLSGDYRGEQDGHSIHLTLEQEGRLVRGAVTDADGNVDALLGSVLGEQVVLIRQSTPVQLWLGTVNLPTLSGPWFGPGGSGVWQAVRVESALTARLGVDPDTIRSGADSAVAYRFTVHNRGTVPADDVVVGTDTLPPFFTITGVEIDREGTVTAAVATTPFRLPLGDLAQDATVHVTVHGTAAPRDPGDFTTVFTADAANTDATSARAALHVQSAANPTLRSAFHPDTIKAESDQRVTYQIMLVMEPDARLTVTNAEILGLLRNAEVRVRGAEATGSLATGLVIGPGLNRATTVHIEVAGSAAHLDVGAYPTTTVVTAAGGGAGERTTATLTVRERNASCAIDRDAADADEDHDADRRDCPDDEDEDGEDRDRDRGRDTDRDRDRDRGRDHHDD